MTTPTEATAAVPGTTREEREHEDFRIESKPKGKRKWVYLAGSFTSARDLDHARRNLEILKQVTTEPGWRYRIVRRHVKTIRITMDWEEVT